MTRRSWPCSMRPNKSCKPTPLRGAAELQRYAALAVLCDARCMKVQEALDLLQSDGWRLVRQKGSHRQLQHPVKAGTVTVAGKPSVDVPPGTLNSILKQAGLKR